MKFYILISAVIILLLNGLVSSATILIVDNHFPTPAGEYATIQLAYDAASSGDTLLLTPSEGGYAGITVSKLVHIVGNGWARPSASVPNTMTSSMTFSVGSAGSSLTGCEVTGSIDISTNNITIKRNKCQYIYIRENCTDLVILQNFVSASRYDRFGREQGAAIYIWPNAKVFISNNIIINNANSGYGDHGLIVCYPSNSIVCNNVFRTQDNSVILDMSGATYSTHSVYNNIVLEGNISGIAASYNNMSQSTQFPAVNGNLQSIDMNTVFVDAANYDFHLKTGSPAIGAGFNGTDCGIYGGTHGFVDNGAPWLPIVYFLNVPTEVNKKDGLNVTVKAKSGN